MKIESLVDECKGVNVTGTVGYLKKRVERDGKEAGTKWYTQFLVLNDVTGNVKNAVTGEEIELEGKSIGVNLKNCTEITEKGQKITILNAVVQIYEKDGEIKKSLSSFEIKGEQKEDPAHPTLPETHVIEDKEPPKPSKSADIAKVPPVYKLTPREQEEREYWKTKDRTTGLMIARQNSNQHATALVCKFMKGSLEEAIAKTILVSNMLVDSVYTGLDYPIKSESKQEDKPKSTKKFEQEMEQETQDNVNNWESEK